jgi:predicted esterase
MAGHQNPLSSLTMTTTLPVQLPVTYLHLNQGPGKPVILFFHGYEDTGAGVVRRTLSDPALFEPYEILAPNGLFPVPVRIEGGFKQTHAWYFADFSKRLTLIPPQISADAVGQLVHKLGLEDRPKILVGFSQGCFFMPFVLPNVKNVRKLIGIAGGYRVNDYPSDLNIPVEGIHGTEDAVVPFEFAKEGFEKLKTKNPSGQLTAIEGLKHTMNDVARKHLRDKIHEAFS